MWWCWDDSLHSVFCSCSLTTVALQVFFVSIDTFWGCSLFTCTDSVFNPCSLSDALQVFGLKFCNILGCSLCSLWSSNLFTLEIRLRGHRKSLSHVCQKLQEQESFKASAQIYWPTKITMRRWTMCNGNDNDNQEYGKDGRAIEIVMRINCLLLRRWIMCNDNVQWQWQW